MYHSPDPRVQRLLDQIGTRDVDRLVADGLIAMTADGLTVTKEGTVAAIARQLEKLCQNDWKSDCTVPQLWDWFNDLDKYPGEVSETHVADLREQLEWALWLDSKNRPEKWRR